MKHIGLMFAMDAEMKTFASALQDLQQKTLHKCSFYTGSIDNKIVTAVVSGMGKVNSALCAADLINIFKVDLVINIGIAGGLDQSLKIGDFLVGTDIVYHDVWCGKPNKYGQVQGLPEMYHSAPELTSQLKEYPQGLMCSGDFFVEKADKLNEIKNLFPAAMSVDMESASIAQTCYLYNKPLLVMRQISDVPGAENHAEQYATFWENAPKKSFYMLQEILKIL